jgi:hypothetical protein
MPTSVANIARAGGAHFVEGDFLRVDRHGRLPTRRPLES